VVGESEIGGRGWGRLNNGIGADWYDILRGTRSQHQQHRLCLARPLQQRRDPRYAPATFIEVYLFYYVVPDVRFRFYRVYMPGRRRTRLALTYRPRHARTGAPRKTRRGIPRICIAEK